jgi:SAM-dependent methyltransferase
MPSLIARLKNFVRGDYNSIRFRYLKLPRDYLLEYAFRMTGRRWVEFYAFRMNRAARNATPDRVSAEYVDRAELQARYLQRKGLAAGHTLLDYGCGVMRLLPWVRPLGVRYVGVDISQERILTGNAMLRERGIAASDYEALPIRGHDLAELGAQRFDFAWAQSVYTHMPPDEARRSMAGIRAVLKPTGRFLLTFSPSSTGKLIRKNQKDWWYTPDLIRVCGERAGFEVVIEPSWDDPQGGMVAELRPR